MLTMMAMHHNSHEHFLLGVTGIPDFLVNLWDWQATIITRITVIVVITSKKKLSLSTC